MDKAKQAAGKQVERLRDLGAAITPRAGALPKFWKRKGAQDAAAGAEGGEPAHADQGPSASGSEAYYQDGRRGSYFGEHGGEEAEARSAQVPADEISRLPRWALLRVHAGRLQRPVPWHSRRRSAFVQLLRAGLERLLERPTVAL